MNIWMQITPDEYELPTAVADTAAELASMCGTSKNNVVSTAWRREHNGRKRQYVRVKVEDEN